MEFKKRRLSGGFGRGGGLQAQGLMLFALFCCQKSFNIIIIFIIFFENQMESTENYSHTQTQVHRPHLRPHKAQPHIPAVSCTRALLSLPCRLPPLPRQTAVCTQPEHLDRATWAPLNAFFFFILIGERMAQKKRKNATKTYKKRWFFYAVKDERGRRGDKDCI